MKETYSFKTLLTVKPTWTNMKKKPVLGGEEPVTNHKLCHDH